MAFNIIRKDSAQRIVYGWASVALANGEIITDSQGDQIAPDELERAVTQYMLDYRAQEATGGGVMHETDGSECEVIASLVTTPDIVAAFGLGENLPVGWILGLKVLDDATWARIISGELQSLSIQGTAERKAA